MHRGQKFLAVIFILVLVLELVLFAFELYTQKHPALYATLVRSALEASLMALTYRGHNWARWVMIVLFGIGCALLLWAIVRTGSPLLAAAELLYLMALYALLWSPGVKEFLAAQRTALKKGGGRGDSGEAPKHEPG